MQQVLSLSFVRCMSLSALLSLLSLVCCILWTFGSTFVLHIPPQYSSSLLHRSVARPGHGDPVPLSRSTSLSLMLILSILFSLPWKALINSAASLYLPFYCCCCHSGSGPVLSISIVAPEYRGDGPPREHVHLSLSPFLSTKTGHKLQRIYRASRQPLVFAVDDRHTL